MEEYIFNNEKDKVVGFTGKEIALYSIREKYLNDKKAYLTTGSWPNVIFSYRDDAWEYYYYFQLMDKDLNLAKYLDFDYDVNKWKRDDIVLLINEYGLGILLALYIYSNIKTNLSFDEWYMKYQNYLCIPTMGNTDSKKIIKR